MTFETNVRKTNLKNLHSEWNQARINEFYGNHIDNLYIPAAYQQHDAGYINVSLNSLEYINSTTGSSYKIQPSDEDSWNHFVSLKAKADELGTFRVEIPVHRSLDGSTKEYTEINSPNGEFGNNLAMEMIENTANVITWTDEYLNLLSIILPVAKTIGSNTYPSGLFDVSNIWKDSQGYYLTNLNSNWTLSLDDGLFMIQRQLLGVAGKNLSEDKIQEYLLQVEEIINAVRNT